MTELRTCGATPCEVCTGMRSAAVEIAAGRGIRAATGWAIARGAQLSPEVARRHYATADECLADAYEAGYEQLLAASLPALTGDGSW